MQCADVPNGNTTDGVKLQIWDCTAGVGDANQQFFYLTSDQNIQWTNKHMCLDLPDGNLASGTQVRRLYSLFKPSVLNPVFLLPLQIQMWACYQDTNQNNQVWNFG
jgi:hypothetical protein